jgi:hypothetical protein
MEGNDIAPFITSKVACMFEGLIANIPDPDEDRGLFRRKKRVLTIEEEARRWKANELPLKSLIHLTTKLEVGVEVYTYLSDDYHEPIEHWLSRKGAVANVYHYDDILHLAEDFKFNRDIRTFYTPIEKDAFILGVRATVVQPDKTWGI